MDFANGFLMSSDTMNSMISMSDSLGLTPTFESSKPMVKLSGPRAASVPPTEAQVKAVWAAIDYTPPRSYWQALCDYVTCRDYYSDAITLRYRVARVLEPLGAAYIS